MARRIPPLPHNKHPGSALNDKEKVLPANAQDALVHALFGAIRKLVVVTNNHV